MAETSNTGIVREQGGNRLTAKDGSVITLEAGSSIVFGDITFTINDDGDVIVTGIPTSEPAAVGALYSNTGVLTLSNGP